MNKMLNLAAGAAAAVGMTLHAETSIRIENGTEKPVTPEVLGVNQLAYGRDSYGFLLPGKKTVQPEMAQILKEIGVRSMRYPGGCGGTHMYDWKKRRNERRLSGTGAAPVSESLRRNRSGAHARYLRIPRNSGRSGGVRRIPQRS